MLLPCAHVLLICQELMHIMSQIRWHKSYMFHYGKADNVTATLKQLAALVPIGVPVEGTAFLKSMTSVESQADFCYPKPISGTTIE